MSTVLAFLIAAQVAAESTTALVPMARFDRARIPESSGVAKSRRHQGIFWVHNDSGNPPLLFAVRADGVIERQFRLNLPSIDWEDITIDDQGHLYLGDIGNNRGALPVRAIYQIDEPDPTSPADRPIEARAATYYALPATNRFDAESLVVDGETATVVAKYRDGREAELFTIPLVPRSTLFQPAKPSSIGRLPGFVEPATGAAVSADRKLLAVCSNTVTRIYERAGLAAGPLVAEVRYRSVQIEGVAWDGLDLVLVAEGVGMFRLPAATWRAAARSKRAPATPLLDPK